MINFLTLTDHRGIVSPSIIEYTSAVTVAQDEGAVLMCVAQGCPAVEYRYRKIVLTRENFFIVIYFLIKMVLTSWK